MIGVSMRVTPIRFVDSWQGSFLFPAFYRRGLFGLVLLRLPQCVTADVELQDDAVMY